MFQFDNHWIGDVPLYKPCKFAGIMRALKQSRLGVDLCNSSFASTERARARAPSTSAAHRLGDV